MPFLLFLLLFSLTLAGAWIKSPTTTNVQARKFCSPGQVLIDHGGKRQCYPLAKLNEACRFNRQCSAQTSNSFCGFQKSDGDDDDLNYEMKCTCDDGYFAAPNGSCVPYKRCSNKQFNSAAQRSADCPVNQFCRLEHCHCIANTERDSAGNCIQIEPELPYEMELKIFQQKFDELNFWLKFLGWSLGFSLMLNAVFVAQKWIFPWVTKFLDRKRPVAGQPREQNATELQESFIQANS